MIRWLAILLLAACGGQGADEPYPYPYGGWCCGELCGLSGEDAFSFETCTCDGRVSPRTEDSRGECLTRTEGT